MSDAMGFLLYLMPVPAAALMLAGGLLLRRQAGGRSPARALLGGATFLAIVDTVVALRTMAFGHLDAFELPFIAGRGFVVGAVLGLGGWWLFARLLTYRRSRLLGALLLLGVCGIACLPQEETVAPAAHLMLVDVAGTPIPDACVSEHWNYDGMRRHYVDAERRASRDGTADLPRRVRRISVAARLVKLVIRGWREQAPLSSAGLFTTERDGASRLGAFIEPLHGGTTRVVMTRDPPIAHSAHSCVPVE